MTLRTAADRALEFVVVPSFTRIGPAARSRMFDWNPLDSYDLAGRVIVLTGATSGIGRNAADHLARAGADLTIVGRDPDRTEQARAEIAAESAELRIALSEVELTNALGEAHGFLTVALSSWDDAMSLLEASLVEVLDGADLQTGESMLENAFDLLRIGDRAYFGFIDALSRLDPELLSLEFGAVGFAADERSALYDAPILAARLRAILKLEGDHDVSVIASIDPEPLVEQGSVPIVPNAETFIVNLVVSNAGNLVEELILVSLVGNPQSADVEQISLQSIVPFLDPGTSTTVSFDVSDLIVPGELYELRAEVQIAQDDSLENNSWSLVLVRNSE